MRLLVGAIPRGAPFPRPKASALTFVPKARRDEFAALLHLSVLVNSRGRHRVRSTRTAYSEHFHLGHRRSVTFRPFVGSQHLLLHRSFSSSSSSVAATATRQEEHGYELDEVDVQEARAVARSMHRLLVRSLYRIWQEDDFIPASTNFELSGLLRLVCDHYSVNKDYQITERNKRWVAHALACRNPFSDVQYGYELTIITPERQSGKYHLVEDNGEFLNKRPVMLAYDTMVLDGRNYLRCTEADESSSISSVSSSASETTSSACRASSHADTMTEEHEACDPHFAALRALFRHLLERQLSTGKVSAKPPAGGDADSPSSSDPVLPASRRVAVLDLGFDLLKIVADFRKEAKFVARQKRLQKRQIDREFEVLTAQTGRRGSSNSSRANRARVRQAKERIKELWLNHPDKAIRDRLFVVCNAIGGSLEGQGGFLPTVPLSPAAAASSVSRREAGSGGKTAARSGAVATGSRSAGAASSSIPASRRTKEKESSMVLAGDHDGGTYSPTVEGVVHVEHFGDSWGRGSVEDDIASQQAEKLDDETKRYCLLELDDILSVDPLHVETLHTRALIFFMDENYTACEEDLQHILSIEKRHFPSLQTLYRLHQALGSKSGMLEALDKFRRAVPRDPDLEAMHHEAMAMPDGREQIGSGPSAGSMLKTAGGTTKTSASSTKNADAVVVGGEISDEVDVAPEGDPVSAAVIEKQDGNGTDGGSRNTTRRGP